MIANKHINKIVAVIMAITVIIILGLMIYSDNLTALAADGIQMEYETAIFDTYEPVKINILMDENDWEDMLANAISEQYYQCDVEINGETFYCVGIRPKGNTSLKSIANDPEHDKYSFKLEFDQFVKGQSCYGLDKLVLNNNFADATNMKEALIYDMFQYMGADASLYNYASIFVNGQYWGLYLALEAVEESFMLRNYGAESGKLYKPDSMDFGYKKANFQRPSGRQVPDWEQLPKGGQMPQMPPIGEDGGLPEDFSLIPGIPGNSPVGFMGRGNSGSDLNYIDDDLDTYSSIWNGEITSSTEKDHKKVVTALKNISQGEDLEKYMDIDNLLKYAAVHIFSVNEDSLSGMMSHNYYLYEANGRLNILPWDYNLALGGMGGRGAGGATGTVNSAIDKAFDGTRFFDNLLEDETYQAQYHAYMQELVDEYLLGGAFEDFYNRTRSQIDELVKNDPNAFYSYDEYEVAVNTLYEVVNLRAQSIDGQLKGTIPSTKEEQVNSDALIDASHLDLSVMGTMDIGGRNSNNANENIPNRDSFEAAMEGGMPRQRQNDNVDSANNQGMENLRPPQTQGSLSISTGGSDTKNIYVSYGISFLTLVLGFLFVKNYKQNTKRQKN